MLADLCSYLAMLCTNSYSSEEMPMCMACGLQIRDLRLLDAQPASSPPAILCRDQAIVVNLEFIKCIITTRAPCLPPCKADSLQNALPHRQDEMTVAVGYVAVSCVVMWATS